MPANHIQSEQRTKRHHSIGAPFVHTLLVGATVRAASLVWRVPGLYVGHLND